LNAEIPDPALHSHWLEAIAHPEIRAALESIYTAASSAIAQRGPTCWASGRCCNFDAHGHRLYVTGLETAYTIALVAPTPGTPPHRGGSSGLPSSPLSLPQLHLARTKGGCPFQLNNLCTVHTIKPLGCRIYFCDKSAQDWQHELSEKLLADIRTLHDAHHIEYRYGEWREMLARFV
jgi:Fe-S-cluster containining protein